LLHLLLNIPLEHWQLLLRLADYGHHHATLIQIKGGY